MNFKLNIHRLNTILVLLFAFSLLAFGQDQPNGSVDSSKRWVGTWSTAPYEAGPYTPPSPYLANNTLRQIVRVSIGGDTLRVKFSNRTCSTAVTMNAVNVAVSNDASTSVIDTSTMKQLTFNGNTAVTMDAYSEVTSDPIEFSLVPGARLAITIYYGQCKTSSDMTFHYGSRTDSYILTGDQTSSANFAGATTVERWYNLSSIDVFVSSKSAAVAVLGNSITDGYGLHGGPSNKWTDFFSEKLLENPATSHVGVLNLGIGATWLTTSGLSRFQKDILEQSGLRWIIVFYGVNDIGGGASANNIINAYKSMISQAHANNIRIYGATITPFNGNSYYSPAHEAIRVEVNNWIRTQGNFDNCIDFDKAIRNPSDTTRLMAIYSNDWLHPNAEGYKFLGESIDLNLFLGGDTLYTQPDTTKIESHYFESECAIVGESWDILSDAQASNGRYVTVKAGTQSLNAAPTDSSGYIIIPFSIDSAGNFSVFARLNCPTYDDDSYWVKIDDGAFQMYNGLVTSGWEWIKIDEYVLTEGEHTLTVAYREDGAKLDKIAISNSVYPPSGMGEEAENLCDPNVPVELKSFNSIPSANKVNLTWETATEVNNSGFEIQRGNYKNNFCAIDFVKGFGTTTKSHSYSYIDNISGNFYYRLKQIDFNGTYTYSDVIEVSTLPAAFKLSQNYPNPFNPLTKIFFSLPERNFVNLKIFDLLGNEIITLVNEEKPAGNYEVNFNAEGLSSGIYYYKLIASNFSDVKKMILMK